MAIFSLSWTPAGGPNSLSQSVKHRLKGSGTWLTTDTTPANPQTPLASAASVSGLTNNYIYEFQIDNACTFGGPTSSAIQEEIVYACIGNVTVMDNGNQTATISIGGLNLLPNLNFAKFFIYDSSNTLLLQTSPNVPVASPTNWTTSALVGGNYYVRVQYGAIVNGIQEFSAFGPSTCRYPFEIE